MKIDRWMVLGGTSRIAQEIMRVGAAEGREFLCTGRDADRLERVCADLTARGAHSSAFIVGEVADEAARDRLWQGILGQMPEFDVLVIAYGSLTDQPLAEQDPGYALRELNTNFSSVVSFLTRAANYFEERKHGTIAVLSSIAGERARRSNYVYGTAKGALSLYCQGMRSRLFPAGVRVLTIKPGPVYTPMTQHLLGQRDLADARRVGKRIYAAIKSGRSDILYVPARWKMVALMLKLLPERIAKRMKW